MNNRQEMWRGRRPLFIEMQERMPGQYTYEPCEDVDPTPDYENVLTD